MPACVILSSQNQYWKTKWPASHSYTKTFCFNSRAINRCVQHQRRYSVLSVRRGYCTRSAHGDFLSEKSVSCVVFKTRKDRRAEKSENERQRPLVAFDFHVLQRKSSARSCRHTGGIPGSFAQIASLIYRLRSEVVLRKIISRSRL